MNPMIIGVGRRGGDIVQGLPPSIDAPILYADTDTDDLESRPEGARLRLGSGISPEDFVRNDPSFSFKAAMMDRAEIEARLEGAGVLLLVAGLGGGTGAGGTRALARIARERGLPAIALVTRPFEVEGDLRVNRARRGFDDLRRELDLAVNFHQDLLVPLVGQTTRMREVVAVADEIIGTAIRSLVTLARAEDAASNLEALVASAPTAISSYGIAESPDQVVQAAKYAFHGPFFQGVTLARTRALAVTLQSRQPVADDELGRAIAGLQRRTNEEAPLIVAQRIDPDLDHAIELNVLLAGEFSEPRTRMDEYYVPGPSG